MGGRIALGAAVLHPERVGRLVLESASPGLRAAADRAARQEADERLADVLEHRGITAFVERWMALPLFASRADLPDATRAVIESRLRDNDPASLAACLRGLGTGTQPSLWGRLVDVAQPTLLISGADDAKFCAIAEDMMSELPSAAHTVVPDAGHTVHREQPAEWLAAVNHFITGS